ncbi:MAG TPA: hypothetical protein PKE03_01320 [Bacteroidales bacterium]|nr:hypothetical protein [Bacteroidales bacterium]
MALRYFTRRRIRRCIQHGKTPALQSLDEAESLIFLTNIQGKEAVLLLNHLQTRFQQAETITLINLSKEKKLTALRDEHRSLIEVGTNNLNFFGGMSKSLQELIKSVGADVLINTDPYSSDLLHLIAANLHTNMKIGMYYPFDLPLYNPLITPNADQSPEAFIDTVNTYLRSLTGKK